MLTVLAWVNGHFPQAAAVLSVDRVLLWVAGIGATSAVGTFIFSVNLVLKRVDELRGDVKEMYARIGTWNDTTQVRLSDMELRLPPKES